MSIAETNPALAEFNAWLRDEMLSRVAAIGRVVTARQVRRRLWRFRMAGGSLLSSMETAGLGHFETRPSGPKGGRPSRVFVLDVPADTSDAEPGGTHESA